MATDAEEPLSRRELLHQVIFEADTAGGKAFDVILLLAIGISVLAVLLESVASIRATWGPTLIAIEWGFTVLFTIEYGLRLGCVRRPLRYATSFFGIVDLLAVLPTYLSLVFAGTHSLLVIRSLRLLRVFRVLKLLPYLREANMLLAAVRASGVKLFVFLGTVLTIVLIMGAVMYLVEGRLPDSGFTSIPRSMYWAIVTLTTVGYGDISPQTDLGRAIAALLMLLGYTIIAVPTGIVSVEIAQAKRISTQACPSCAAEGHRYGARHCYQCGAHL
jgi:voltage-gated potassium channel